MNRNVLIYFQALILLFDLNVAICFLGGHKCIPIFPSFKRLQYNDALFHPIILYKKSVMKMELVPISKKLLSNLAPKKVI